MSVRNIQKHSFARSRVVNNCTRAGSDVGQVHSYLTGAQTGMAGEAAAVPALGSARSTGEFPGGAHTHAERLAERYISIGPRCSFSCTNWFL